MPAYCTNCGKAITGAFCVNCGQRAQAESATVPSPPPAAPPARSSLAKPLLITGGIVLVLFVAAIAGAVYSVHWIKNKALSKMSAYTGVSMGRTGTGSILGRGKACTLLTRDELEQVLGVAVEKSAEIMEGSEPGCAYYTNSAGFVQLRQAAADQARRDTEAAAQQTPAAKSDNPLELLKHTKELEGVVKSFGLMQEDKDGRVFAFTVDGGFGREHWATLRTTMSVVPGFEEVSGIGDHAMVGSFGHALYVLKGDSLIKLETMYVPEARTRGAEIGRRIAARM